MTMYVCIRLLALEHFKQKLFEHNSYNPDLTSSDYNLFTYLKNWLRSQHFNNNKELMEGVETWLSSHAADFFETGTQKLIPSIRQVPQFQQ
jgi:hypothetical protein